MTPGQSFSYLENRAANALVGTVVATDQIGVVGFRFAATGTQTSADGFFAIDGTGVIRLTAAGAAAGAATNDFEIAPNTFGYAVQAADAAGNWSAAENVVLTVTDIDEPVITGPGGVAGAPGSAVSVNENQTAATTVAANKPVTWAITGGADAGRFAIGATTGVITFVTAPDFEAPTDTDANNSYALIVTATDGAGVVSSQAVTVTVLDLAEAPLAFANTNATSNGDPSYAYGHAENSAAGAVLGTVAAGGGTGPYVFAITAGDPNGWYAIDPATGAIALSAAGAASPANDLELAPNTQTLTVRVTDAANATASTTVALTETDVDDTAPVITGPGGTPGATTAVLSVNENLTAVTTLAADGPATWSIVGGEDAGRFAVDPATGTIIFVAAPDFETPADSDADNAYLLTVRAQDAAGNSSTQTITVAVLDLDEAAPVVTGPGGGAVSVNEGTTAVTTLTASETVSWAITGGVDAGRFAIDAATGAISFVAAPDFENPADADANNSYLLTVTATDAAENTGTQSLAVTVLDLDDTAPIITGPTGGAGAATSALSLNEGVTAVTTLTASEAVTWSIVGGSDGGRFAIQPATGAITFQNAPDFEAPTDSDTNNSYILTVRATDGAGLSSIQTVTVTVLNLDDTAPVITGPSGGAGAATSARSVNEGTIAVATFGADEAVAWTITGGADAGRFTIDPSTGALAFAVAPDFEAPTDADTNNAYLLTVTATDTAGNASAQAVTATVLDLDDSAPVIGGASAVSVNEGQTAVTTATANETVTWSIGGGADASRFAIDPGTGAITFVASPDYEAPADADADNSYVLTVTATDAQGNASTQGLTVTVLDLDDTAPAITGPSGGAGATASAVSRDEGVLAVATFSAGEPVTWAIGGGADAARFAIDPFTGALRFLAATDFEAPVDADTDNAYLLTVTATDAGGNRGRQDVTVTVLDVDDAAPVIGGGGTATSASVPVGQSAVATLGASEAVSWSVSGGPDAARFAIEAATGAIRFVTAPDFEQPADAGADNVYDLIVTATDATGNAATRAVIVTVTDLDDSAPVIGGADGATVAFTVAEGTPAVATLTASEQVGWAITGGTDAARFAIDPATGAVAFRTAPISRHRPTATTTMSMRWWSPPPMPPATTRPGH